MEKTKKILKPLIEEFNSKFVKTIKLNGKLVGGSIKVGLLKKFIEIMDLYDNSPEEFTFNRKVYKKDPEFASRVLNVYTQGEGSKMEVFILHHPTDKYNFEDLTADIGLALNYRSSRVKDNVKKQIEVEDKYLKITDNITTIGYSLGAFVAEDASDNSKSKEIVLISRPITFLNLKKILGKNVFSIKSPLDPVGLLYKLTGDINKEIFANPEKPISSIMEFFKEHLAPVILERFDPDKTVEELKESLPVEMEDKMVGKGLDKEKFSKRRVSDLKEEVKRKRKEKRLKASDYKVTGKNKKQLITLLEEIEMK